MKLLRHILLWSAILTVVDAKMKKASGHKKTRLRVLKEDKDTKITKSTKIAKTSKIASSLPEIVEDEIPEGTTELPDAKFPENGSQDSGQATDGQGETPAPSRAPITVEERPSELPEEATDSRIETPSPSAPPVTVALSPSPVPKGGTSEPDDDWDDRGETPSPSSDTLTVQNPTIAPLGPSPTITPEVDNGAVGPPDGLASPSSVPSDAPSLLPSHSPSLTPSNAPSIRLTTLPVSTPPPSNTPVVAPVTSPPFTFDDESSRSYITDPNDPSSFICVVDGNAESVEAIEGIVTLPVSFVYQLWLDNSQIELDSVLPQVELSMADAVANSVLICEGNNGIRRLQQGIWSVSASPIDTQKETCDTGCYRMNGELTLTTMESTGEEYMKMVCSAINVVQDASVMTIIAMSVDGVGAIRYEESSVWCGTGTDTIDEANEEEQLPSSDSNLGGGVTAVIAMASVILVLVFFVAARRRRREPTEDMTAELGTTKDVLTLQPTYSSSRSLVGFGGVGYTILAENQSFPDDEEGRSEPPSPAAATAAASAFTKSVPTTKSFDEPTKAKSWDPFRLDQTDLPDRLSLQSSEGGSIDGDGDDDSQNLKQYVNPVQLAAGRRRSPKAASPPERGLQIDITQEPSDDENEGEKVLSPMYPGLSSLLGVDSDGTSTDEDRSVAQIYNGGVRLLKMSDLEGSNDEENSTSSGQHET